MRVGILARAEDRGLGLMASEFYRALSPAAALVVEMPAPAAFPMHLDRFPGQPVVPFDGHRLAEGPVREVLAELDVLYMAETAYDWRVCGWAREAGCATVLHAMPEFYRHGAEVLEAPDRVWAPTPWRLDCLPPGTPLVPVPVAGDRFRLAAAPPAADGVLRLLHVAGHRAGADRNGTLDLLRALRYVREPVRVTITSQDVRLPKPGALISSSVELVMAPGGVGQYWDLYEGHDVLVMPRRYGGLCLPVQEAMAAGLAVLMTDVAPNDWWPTIRVQTRTNRDYPTPGGVLRIADTSPQLLAWAIDRLVLERERVHEFQEASVRWARAHSWEALGDVYRHELERAAG